MYKNQLPFFQFRSNIDIQKNSLAVTDPHFQHMKFLILMLQISYFFNIQQLTLHVYAGQTQVIKNIYLLCGGMLIFLTVTIYLVWTTDHNFYFENTFSKKRGFN